MFWNKKEKPWIKFHTDEHLLDLIPHPVPAKRAMPAWFKKLRPELGDKINIGTVKRCKPVLDAVSQGYIIPLWADLQIKVAKEWLLFDENGNQITSVSPLGDNPEDFIGKTIDDIDGNPTIAKIELGEVKVNCTFPNLTEVMQRGDMISSHSWDQVGNACDLKKFKLGKTLMKFTNPWTIQTPPGYSVQVKNPANNWSNDIALIEGVVDTDEYYNEVNFPFVWTGSEEGEWIIPRGTPLAHVVPFKREEMELEIGAVDVVKKEKVHNLMMTKLYDMYATFYWHKRRT